MTTASEKLFAVGTVVMTVGIDALLQDEKSELSDEALTRLLQRHQCGDDGDVNTEDHESNLYAIQQGDLRIMSVYKLETVTVWIITEHDRSYTTVLLPEEY